VITIASALPAHDKEIAELAKEMDQFYGATEFEPIESRIRQINEALFTDHPTAHAVLAWDDEKLVGFASYSLLWPAVGLTSSLYVKELYVSATVRRKGVGKLLMQYIFNTAAANGCSRVEWTTDSDNQESQLFYAGLGVPVNDSKLFYRVEGDRLTGREFATQDVQGEP
jgi:GNAT superfamily N-acetyltransferase